MKIITSDLSGLNIFIRPDNTLSRQTSGDLFLPHYIKGITIVIGFAFKVDRPAKSIAQKFVSRYVTSYTPALLIKGEIIEGYSSSTFWTLSNSIDSSSRIPLQLLPIVDSPLQPPLLISDKESFTNSSTSNISLHQSSYISLHQLSGAALERLSSLFLIKIGDFIFTETASYSPKVIQATFNLQYNDNQVLDLRIR